MLLAVATVILASSAHSQPVNVHGDRTATTS